MLSVARPSLRPFFVFLSILFACASSIFGQCGSLGANSTSWTGGAGTQNFGTAGNWTANDVPTAALNTCIINGTAGTPVTVALAGATANVDSLQLNANNTLNVGNDGSLLVFGPLIINGGAINFTNGGTNSVLGLETSTTLSGGGVLTLATTNLGSGAAIIFQQLAGVTLTNQSTIQGAGIIGDGGGLAE